MNRTLEVLAAFGVGAAAGAAAALLWAPEKGEVTRKRLKDAATDLYKNGEHLVKDTREAFEAKAHAVGGTVKHRVEAVREALHEGQEAYHRELERAAS